MLKKLLIAAVAVLILAATALYFRAQSIFSSDLVRTGVEAQLSNVLGQPVAIGSIGATILPRVTMVLSDVRIGNPARITIARLDVGASARALLSRRIEQATVSVSGARIELPLPPLAIGAGGGSDGSPAVAIGSIHSVELSDVAVVSGGRTLRGDIRVLPRGRGMHIETMTLRLDDTAVEVTGDITDFAGPTGTLTLQASSLAMLDLQAFATDFSGGAGIDSDTDTHGPAAPMDLTIEIKAERATFGTLALANLQGHTRATNERLTIDPMTFAVFDGHFSGATTLSLAATPAFAIRGELTDVDMGALTTYAGKPDAVTGRLRASLAAEGRGTTADAVIGNTTGTVRVDVADGTVQGLGLVRTLVVASSMRAGAVANAGDGNEAFSRLGATFLLGNGLARTSDLTFESTDVSLAGAGQIGLDGTAIDLTGRLQLSEALSQQAGRDLVRYTQEGGRVTVPVSITGSAGALRVQLETADVLKRAVTNKAVEEAGEAVRRGLGGLFGR